MFIGLSYGKNAMFSECLLTQYYVQVITMSKNNLKRKKEILALLCQGLSGVDIRETLGLSQGVLNHTVSWLVDNGYMRRVRKGKYTSTGKPWPMPRSGNT